MSESRPTISTHVLDTATGQPAVGIKVTLDVIDDVHASTIATAMTDHDGRVRDLLSTQGEQPRPLSTGRYRLTFDVATAEASFFRELTVEFEITDTSRSYHVPLLLAPFGMTTYRGS